MDARSKVIKTILENGAILYVETTPLGGEQLIHSGAETQFREVTRAIEGLADAFVTTFKKVTPRRASVEFGLEVAVESGKLTSLLVKGTGNANVKVTLEWGEGE